MLKYHRLLTISQGLPLTPETIESSYVSAVINLWKEQCLEETNPYPSPRGEYLKTFMVNLQISRAQLWRSNYEDRAINNLKDGYTMDEMRKMTDHLMGDMAARSEEKSLRTRLDLQWLHAMMLRSESTRYAEYADLCSKRLENEGPTCLAIILRISQGKTVNRQDAANSRKTMYTGVLRNKEVLLCPVGALAFWLSYRWDVFGEEFPDFSDRASWFATKVVPGKLSAPKTEITYRTQNTWVKNLFSETGITSSKVLHTPRKTVARMMDLFEVPAEQVSASFRHPLQNSSNTCD